MKLLSPKAEALKERKRIAMQDGAKAMAEFAARDIAARNNMARLRALRLKKEAEAVVETAPSISKRKRKR